VLLLLALPAWRWLEAGAAIASGYSAKQLCSGVFVAGLPESYVLEKDINRRMAMLGPALPLLDVQLDQPSGSTRASLLGVVAHAVYWPGLGCVLNPEILPPQAGPGSTSAAREPAVALTGEEKIADVLEQAFVEPGQGQGQGQRETLAVVVMRNGYIVAEHYRDPVTPLTPMQGWSMNKSLLATWVGMQVQREELSLRQPVREVLESGEDELAQQVNPELRLDHLLHMESGLDFRETYTPGDDATHMLYSSAPMWRASLQRGQTYPPGIHFSYSSGDTNTAAFIWQLSLGELDYASWLQRNFYGQLGIRSAVSEPDATGYQVGSSYTYMTARDWARVGQLWLDAWHGRSELLGSEWQRAATTPRASSTTGNYGRGFWLNAQGKDFPDLPRNMFYAGGNSGQYVVVLPEQELVVVRLGLTDTGTSTGLDELLRGVLDAI
jgi:CubicO group peptidase (beta-lactamase class C family)